MIGLQGVEPDAALALTAVDPGVLFRPATWPVMHVGRVGVNEQARVDGLVLAEERCEMGERGKLWHKLPSGMRWRLQDDKAVGPALAAPRPHEPAGASMRQRERGRVEVHPHAWAAVEQPLEVPLETDPRVVG